MEHSWRGRLQAGNFCPVCSNSHFPFCAPLPQYFRPPPPPPSHHSDQYFHRHLPPLPPHPPAYDPFVDHRGASSVNLYTPPLPLLPPRPLVDDPSYRINSFGNLTARLDYDNGNEIGAKRMRIDNFGFNMGHGSFMNDNHVSSLGEDERRLKLIREHGAVHHVMDRNYDLGSKFPGNAFDKRNSFCKSFQGAEGGYSQECNHIKGRIYDAQFDSRNYQNAKIVESGPLPYDRSESNLFQNSIHGTDGYKNMNQAPIDNPLPNSEMRYQIPRENHYSLPLASKHQALEPEKMYHGFSNLNEHLSNAQRSQDHNAQPPLPTSPPPPLPVEPTGFCSLENAVSIPLSGDNFRGPIPSESASSQRSSNAMISEVITSASNGHSSKVNLNSNGYYAEDIQGFPMPSSKKYLRGNEEVQSHQCLPQESKVVDAAHILKKPHRDQRPDHIVIILRGLPGSGKSYLAKLLRDIEVENGGCVPRIHSMDDYFMVEVEKAEEGECSKSIPLVRGKKQVLKKIMEYCYEPEMEEAYRSSMLKAFKKTLDEGVFSFVIVDDRNLRVADFAQFWATAKRSGYEVYLLEATYRDPAGCAARNVHGFTQPDIQKMAGQWEDAPCLYMKLDIKSLLHSDVLEENGIQEVDMDTEDGDHDGAISGSEETNVENIICPSKGPLNNEHKWDSTEQCPLEVVKELGQSKWSNDVEEEEDVQKANGIGVHFNVLSGLAKSYSKLGKSVYWADQVGSIGFSIGSGKTSNVSLIIGPGSGYNVKSNPLPKEEKLERKTGGSKRLNIFQEQLRAEHEAFRAVFDRRRHRIGGLDLDEE